MDHASTSSKYHHHFCGLANLPKDLIQHCILSYLRKGDQYNCLSTCTAWKPLLLECRSVYITDEIPFLTFENRQFSVYLWERFIKEDPQHVSAFAGCYIADIYIPIRKLRMKISIEELQLHKDFVMNMASCIFQLTVTKGRVTNSQYLLPITIQNPTNTSIQRWLLSTYNSQSILDGTHEEICWIFDPTMDTRMFCERLHDFRGINKIFFKDDKANYVELGSDDHACLQSVSFEYCARLVHLPLVPNLTIRNCPSVTNFEALTATDFVHLEGLVIDDIKMLGGVTRLVVVDCKINHYPTPFRGKGQDWEFRGVDIVDVSIFSSLEKLALTDCIHVQDGRRLGSVQKLTINGTTSIANYPIPKSSERQEWKLLYLEIQDVLGMAKLEKLTLAYCDGLKDISMLGNVRYLTIHKCKGIVSSAHFPIPTGRFQEWTFIDMNLKNLHWSQQLSSNTSLCQLTLFDCAVNVDIWLNINNSKSITFVNVFCVDWENLWNIYTLHGKAQIVDRLTLKSAVNLWCTNKSIAFNIFGDISTWDVSKVSDMSQLFEGKHDFNDNIKTWDLRHTITFRRMFCKSRSFNQPLDSWNISNNTDMTSMFNGASSFNQPLDSWDVSNVTNMSSMFNGASSFNQPLRSWCVKNVTNMSCMFYKASSFNQPLDSWDVSNVTNISGMFEEASSFNQPMNSWDIGNVTNLDGMFCEASSFNQSLDSWNVSNVTNMSSMFHGASSFNQPLNSWNVNNVKDMSGMFYKAASFNQPLDTWDVSNVMNISYMFYGASSFNHPLNSWDVSKVKDVNCMFYGASSFNQPLDSWDVSNVTNMSGMFSGASSFNQPLDSWDVSNVKNMSWMFYGASSFNQPFDSWNVNNVKDMSGMFRGTSYNSNPLRYSQSKSSMID